MQGICDRSLRKSKRSFQVCDLFCSKVTGIAEELSLFGTGKIESFRDPKQSMHQFSALLIVQTRELGVKSFLVVSERESRVTTDCECTVGGKAGNGRIVVLVGLLYELTDGKVVISIEIET